MRYTTMASLLFGGCAYEAPLNTVSAPKILNAVNGEILFAGEGEVASTWVTVFDANAPGPPVGTGSPVALAAVSERAWSVDGAGLRSAPYGVTHLPNGSWLLNALMDSDGDFNPLSSALAGATCGDWGGAYLSDLATGTPAAIEMRGGTLYDDITIVVGQQFGTERPAFVFSGTPALGLGDILTGAAPPLFRLRTTTVDTAFSEDLRLTLGPACEPSGQVPDCGLQPVCPCELPTLAPCGTAFWVWLKDTDADGIVDPYPAEAQAAQGLLDVWPRVFLEYTGELEPFEFDGALLSERWVAESFPLAGEIGVAAATAQVPPGAAAAAFGPIGTPFPVNELSVTFAPVFRHYHAGGTVGEDANGPFDVVDLTAGAPPSDVPAGGWAVTVVSFTGQTWTVPNDLGLLGLPSLDPDFDPVSQGAVLVISP